MSKIDADIELALHPLMRPLDASQAGERVQASCHCGAVTVCVAVSLPTVLRACNCSICDKLGFLHLIVHSEQFQLITGLEALSEYRFNTGVARHWFCRHCGVKPFYRPRSHPDGISVNGRCLNDVDWKNWEVQPFDGRNWEQSVAGL